MNVDPYLLELARRLGEHSTKRATVDAALRCYISHLEKAKDIRTIVKQGQGAVAGKLPAGKPQSVRYAKILRLAVQVLEDEETARQWLHEPQFGLGWRTPIEIMRTNEGAREVERLLIRIEKGVVT